ncbi:hypothetical protein SK128_028204 [Halocaridina rubra]|uniref:Uncharacterized protein n=1 Tax=Halocaridina rubra TaxID=373956 RepID=A0AAN8X7R1_HALRR
MFSPLFVAPVLLVTAALAVNGKTPLNTEETTAEERSTLHPGILGEENTYQALDLGWRAPNSNEDRNITKQSVTGNGDIPVQDKDAISPYIGASEERNVPELTNVGHRAHQSMPRYNSDIFATNIGNTPSSEDTSSFQHIQSETTDGSVSRNPILGGTNHLHRYEGFLPTVSPSPVSIFNSSSYGILSPSREALPSPSTQATYATSSEGHSGTLGVFQETGANSLVNDATSSFPSLVQGINSLNTQSLFYSLPQSSFDTLPVMSYLPNNVYALTTLSGRPFVMMPQLDSRISSVTPQSLVNYFETVRTYPRFPLHGMTQSFPQRNFQYMTLLQNHQLPQRTYQYETQTKGQEMLQREAQNGPKTASQEYPQNRVQNPVDHQHFPYRAYGSFSPYITCPWYNGFNHYYNPYLS